MKYTCGVVSLCFALLWLWYSMRISLGTVLCVFCDPSNQAPLGWFSRPRFGCHHVVRVYFHACIYRMQIGRWMYTIGPTHVMWVNNVQPFCLHLFESDSLRLHYDYDWTYPNALAYVECHVVRAHSLGIVIHDSISMVFIHAFIPSFPLIVTLMIFYYL